MRISRSTILGVILPFVLFSGGGILLFGNIPPVVLFWETASEVGTAGFNVYRTHISEANFVRINPTLIPAQGNEIVGSNYRFVDDDVSIGRRYIYHIEEVEWDGMLTTYSETATVRAGLPRFWIKIEGGLLIVVAVVMSWRRRTRTK